MDLKELYLKRQSTREYTEKPVSDEILTEICSMAKLAPSAVNSQPYKMHAITGEKAKQFAPFVQNYGNNYWTMGCPAFIAIEQGMPPLIVRMGQKIVKTEFVPIDIGILTAYIVLAAESLGVQSCIIGIRDEKAIAKFLDLKEGTKFPVIIALGYAPEGYEIREKRRLPLYENFDLTK